VELCAYTFACVSVLPMHVYASADTINRAHHHWDLHLHRFAVRLERSHQRATQSRLDLLLHHHALHPAADWFWLCRQPSCLRLNPAALLAIGSCLSRSFFYSFLLARSLLNKIHHHHHARTLTHTGESRQIKGPIEGLLKRVSRKKKSIEISPLMFILRQQRSAHVHFASPLLRYIYIYIYI